MGRFLGKYDMLMMPLSPDDNFLLGFNSLQHDKRNMDNLTTSPFR